MSDAELNYEHTKKNVKVPQGWMLVDDIQRMDPTHKSYMWWHPTEGSMGAWLAVDLTNAEQTNTMSTLWNAGSTCFIEKDPNPAPVPPPPPAFLAGGFAPPVPPALVPPSEAVAAPVPPPSAPATAPILPPPPTPVATPVPASPAVPAAPTFVPPPPPVFHAPAMPVAAPAPAVAPVITAVPQAPAPKPIPVIPVVARPATPAPMPVPTAPNTPVATVPQVPEAEAEGESSADQNEVDAWLSALDGVKDRIKALEAVKSELVQKIVKVCFPNGLHEGAQNCKLPDGRKLTITGVVNRTFDDALVDSVCRKVIDAGGNPEGVFVTKLAIGTAAYKALPLQYRNLLADCVTEKEGTPQLKVTELKK